MEEREIKAQSWDALMRYFERSGKCVSLREARRLVGGSAHLETLIAEHKIQEVDRDVTSANSKRMFPAAQVYAHVRAK